MQDGNMRRSWIGLDLAANPCTSGKFTSKVIRSGSWDAKAKASEPVFASITWYPASCSERTKEYLSASLSSTARIFISLLSTGSATTSLHFVAARIVSVSDMLGLINGPNSKRNAGVPECIGELFQRKFARFTLLRDDGRCTLERVALFIRQHL